MVMVMGVGVGVGVGASISRGLGREGVKFKLLGYRAIEKSLGKSFH